MRAITIRPIFARKSLKFYKRLTDRKTPASGPTTTWLIITPTKEICHSHSEVELAATIWSRGEQDIGKLGKLCFEAKACG